MATENSVLYGFLKDDDRGIMLSMSDALYGDRLDKEHGHPRPMLDFDPFDHARVTVQDAIFAESGVLPDIWAGWRVDLKNGVRHPRWAGTDKDFESYCQAIHDCCRLPLEEEFHNALVDLWDAWIMPETQRRILMVEKRRRGLQYKDGGNWEEADLVAEVEAVCGPGKPQGRQVAFPCPFHPDRHPSLMVDPEKKTWFCFPCDKGGGVTGWRRAIRK